MRTDEAHIRTRSDFLCHFGILILITIEEEAGQADTNRIFYMESHISEDEKTAPKQLEPV